MIYFHTGRSLTEKQLEWLNDRDNKRIYKFIDLVY